MKSEAQFQQDVIKELKEMFPGCIITKNDPRYIQGIPDWEIKYKNMWAALEMKKSKDEPHQPNQDYYVDLMNRMSFAAFIYPENKDDVLSQLDEYFSMCEEDWD